MRRPSLFAHSFLLRQLVRRDFESRYAGSLLGFAWSLLQPLWQLLLFSFVFGSVLRVTPTGEHTGRFWVFLFCGLLPWAAVQEGVLRGTSAVTDNSNLVKKLRFPPQVLVLAVALGALVHELLAGVVFLVVLGAVGELAWRGLPWLLLAVPLQLMLTYGLGLLLATVQVFYRDTVQALGMILTAWFYLTPIVYPAAMVPGRLRSLIAWNPLTGLVALYRAALLGGSAPELTPLLVLAACATALLLLGWLAFRRLQPGFVDEL